MKIFFPYDNWDNFDWLKIEGFLNKDKFYNSLTNRVISDKNYEHVLNVLKEFWMEIMKDYHSLLLQVDVLLFSWEFETFRRRILHKFLWIRSCSAFYLFLGILGM